MHFDASRFEASLTGITPTVAPSGLSTPSPGTFGTPRLASRLAALELSLGGDSWGQQSVFNRLDMEHCKRAIRQLKADVDRLPIGPRASQSGDAVMMRQVRPRRRTEQLMRRQPIYAIAPVRSHSQVRFRVVLCHGGLWEAAGKGVSCICWPERIHKDAASHCLTPSLGRSCCVDSTSLSLFVVVPHSDPIDRITKAIES